MRLVGAVYRIFLGSVVIHRRSSLRIWLAPGEQMVERNLKVPTKSVRPATQFGCPTEHSWNNGLQNDETESFTLGFERGG